jgi:hypothetical protein
MRETCLFCVTKHIAKAIVLVCEAVNGYPLHIHLAVGNLSEAEDECASEFPELSHKIRDTRLTLMGQEGEFDHNSLMNLLKDTRAEAEKVNGIPEEERISKILHPLKKALETNKIINIKEVQTL